MEKGQERAQRSATSLLKSGREWAKRAAEDGKEKSATLKSKGGSLVGSLKSKLISAASSAAESPPRPRSGSCTEDDKIASLCALGYSVAAVRHALRRCRGSLEQAGVWLIDEQNQDELLAAQLQAEAAGPLEIGCQARVAGLQGATQLNGQEVLLHRWDEDAQRWIVRLTCGAEKAIRPRNLERVVPVAPSSASTSSSPASSRFAQAEELRQQIRKLLGDCGADQEEVLVNLTVDELRELLHGASDAGHRPASEASPVQIDASQERALRLEAAEARASGSRQNTMDDWRRSRGASSYSKRGAAEEPLGAGVSSASAAQVTGFAANVDTDELAPENLILDVDQGHAMDENPENERLRQEALIEQLRAELERERSGERRRWKEEMEDKEAEVMALRTRLSEAAAEAAAASPSSSSTHMCHGKEGDGKEFQSHAVDSEAPRTGDRSDAEEPANVSELEIAQVAQHNYEELMRRVEELEAERTEWKSEAEQRAVGVEEELSELEQQRDEIAEVLCDHDSYLKHEMQAQNTERDRMENQRRSLVRMQQEVLRRIKDSRDGVSEADRPAEEVQFDDDCSSDGEGPDRVGDPSPVAIPSAAERDGVWDLDWSAVGQAESKCDETGGSVPASEPQGQDQARAGLPEAGSVSVPESQPAGQNQDESPKLTEVEPVQP